MTHPMNSEELIAKIRKEERDRVAQWMARRNYATGPGGIEDLLGDLEVQAKELGGSHAYGW